MRSAVALPPSISSFLQSETQGASSRAASWAAMPRPRRLLQTRMALGFSDLAFSASTGA